MSTLSQSERQALNDVFNAIDTNEKPFSKFKNTVGTFVYFVKYFLKEKTNTKFPIR